MPLIFHYFSMFFALFSSLSSSADYCYVGKSSKTCPEGSVAIDSITQIIEHVGVVNIYLFNGDTSIFTVHDNYSTIFTIHLTINLIGENYDHFEYVHLSSPNGLYFSFEKVKLVSITENFEPYKFVLKNVQFAENIAPFNVTMLETDISSFNDKINPTKNLILTVDGEITATRDVSVTETTVNVATNLKITTGTNFLTLNDKIKITVIMESSISVTNHKVEVEQQGVFNKKFNMKATNSEISILNEINNILTLTLSNSAINLRKVQNIGSTLVFTDNSSLIVNNQIQIGKLDLKDDVNIITDDSIVIYADLLASNCTINSNHPIKFEGRPKVSNTICNISSTTAKNEITIGHYLNYYLDENLKSFNLISDRKLTLPFTLYNDGTIKNYTFNKIDAKEGIVFEFASGIQKFQQFVQKPLTILSASSINIQEISMKVEESVFPWDEQSLNLFTKERVNADIKLKDNEVIFTLLNHPLTTYLPVLYTASDNPPKFFGVTITPIDSSIKKYVNEYTKGIKIFVHDNVTDFTLDFSDIDVESKCELIFAYDSYNKIDFNPEINVDLSNINKFAGSLTISKAVLNLASEVTFDLEFVSFNRSSMINGDYKFSEKTIVFSDIDIVESLKLEGVKKMGLITYTTMWTSIEQGDHIFCANAEGKRVCTPQIDEMFMNLDRSTKANLNLITNSNKITPLTILHDSEYTGELILDNNYRSDVPILRVLGSKIIVKSGSNQFPIISDPGMTDLNIYTESLDPSYTLPLTSDELSLTMYAKAKMTVNLKNDKTNEKTKYTFTTVTPENIDLKLTLNSTVGTSISGFVKSINYEGTGVIDFYNLKTNESVLTIHAGNEKTVPVVNFPKDGDKIKVNLIIKEITGECKQAIFNNDGAVSESSIIISHKNEKYSVSLFSENSVTYLIVKELPPQTPEPTIQQITPSPSPKPEPQNDGKSKTKKILIISGAIVVGIVIIVVIVLLILIRNRRKRQDSSSFVDPGKLLT